MGTKSSIHVKTVSAGSESHNQRTKTISYVVTEFTPDNESFILSSIEDTRLDIETRYLKSVGQKMQKSASPIREGVLIIEKQHGAKDLKELAAKIENRFGIRTIQAYAHKDEGHRDLRTNEWKPNYHAHMVFDWTDKNTGKTLKLDREDMSEMQTIVSDTLGLERGVKSTKKHIDAIQFKIQEEKKSLNEIYKIKGILPETIHLFRKVKSMQDEIKVLETSKNDFLSNISILEKEKEKKENEFLKIQKDIDKEQYKLINVELEVFNNSRKSERLINEFDLQKEDIANIDIAIKMKNDYLLDLNNKLKDLEKKVEIKQGFRR